VTKNKIKESSKKALKKLSTQGDKAMAKTLDEMTADELVVLFNKHSDTKVKKFKDKATALRRTIKLLKDKGIALPARVAKAAKAAKGSGPKKPRTGKMQKIRDLFSSRKKATLDEIIEVSGFDKHNAQSAMNILKNPGRTKPELMVKTEYDRATKTYVKVTD